MQVRSALKLLKNEMVMLKPDSFAFVNKTMHHIGRVVPKMVECCHTRIDLIEGQNLLGNIEKHISVLGSCMFLPQILQRSARTARPSNQSAQNDKPKNYGVVTTEKQLQINNSEID